MTTDSVLHLLLTIVVLGLFGGGMSLFIRVLPIWPKALLTHPHWFWQKFFGCAGCAGSRGVFFGCLWWFKDSEMTLALASSILFIFLAASMLASWLYSQAAPMPMFVGESVNE